MTGGLAFEGINNAGHLGKQMLVVLNDNEMSISPNVGAISKYFTRLISNPLYNKVRNEFWESLQENYLWPRRRLEVSFERLKKV